VFGSSGVLYGTTLGGNGVAGTIFQMAPPSTSGGPWALTVLHSFPYNSGDSQNFSPNGTVLIGPGGTLYATTQGPSLQLGLAIALAPPSASGGDWTEYQIYAFPGTPNAGGPFAGVVAEGGSLFGTTFTGGDEGCGADFGCGTVYQLASGPTHGSAWTGSVLHTFVGSDGNAPEAALAVGPGGALYGTTSNGGSGSACQQSQGGCGTVFQLIPPATSGGTWTFSVIYNFTGIDGDGAQPVSSITVGKNGAIYGTTEAGGSVASDSACPGSALYQLYPGCGTVFELTPPSISGETWTETVLHSFSGQNGDGAIPVAGLVLSSGGVLYGTTSAGGTAGKGTAFALQP
ncbi:MAG TPA: choice-of-anchor tandem repeat GloVer-containing protein, partial [Bryobacteraceae bacterium]|nr:choice-of-anchor tandem repeat GloVer-containing protein [Bryobacteraceae bacterium]